MLEMCQQQKLKLINSSFYCNCNEISRIYFNKIELFVRQSVNVI